jgi:hypothetical protein
MLEDIREQRDRWQQQAERLAALAITDQRKEPAPAQPYLRRPWLRTPTRELLFSVDCGPDVLGRSVPRFEERKLGRLDAERRELLAHYESR